MKSYFHPVVQEWFETCFQEPTRAQQEGWPAIAANQHTLIAAPTGSGKTLAAFLSALDKLFKARLAGELGQQTKVLYISPLKALSNDIQRNLEKPLAGISELFARSGQMEMQITSAVRSGDTTPAQRQAIVKKPPHILVTTPESLYLLLTSKSGRKLLSRVETLIVDEIHALMCNRRGAHLALSVERLQALVEGNLQRIALSATQKPMDLVARFLVGTANLKRDGSARCTIVDQGHLRELDLALELPDSPLQAVMSNEVWEEIYRRLLELIDAHSTTLIFANTRRLAERLCYHLASKLGDDAVTSHHGSLSLRNRHRTEKKLKDGTLRAVVATASLELGIDIGHVDLVCQLGSPRTVSTFLQRIGRSGHYHGGLPRGRLFPLTRDELAECTALIDCTRQGKLDELVLDPGPIDVLCQQVVAAVACEDLPLDTLYLRYKQAWLFRDLSRDRFKELVYMLADGYDTKRGRRGAYLYYDAVNGMLKARKGARLTALTNGGAIPDNADYSVLQQPQSLFIGTLNEDFAVESMPGDVFQLGNHSWRILKIETGKVLVEDAAGQPPSIPFWIGEAPSRSEALSAALSELRVAVAEALDRGEQANRYLQERYQLAETSADQLGRYLTAAHQALACLPSLKTLVIERFFDASGGMQMVIHSAYGARLNRAWGLALRKRFCRGFNFELQAAATDDAIVLSLGPKHAFPLEDVYQFLHTKTVRDLLVQALLAAPMFQTRWRWNATRALAMLRFRGGRRVPPAFQRMDAEDLLAVIFPDQQACLENIAGDREIPDHPLVQQTIDDCLYEYMDLKGLITLLGAIEAGEIRCVAVDLPEPSPLAHEVLSAKPYAFLDDAPLEERRTQAVYLRKDLDLEKIRGQGFLEEAAIATVREQAFPGGSSIDEVHEALQLLGALQLGEPTASDPHWKAALDALAQQGRAGLLRHQGPAGELDLHIAAESEPCWVAAVSEAQITPKLVAPHRDREQAWQAETARVAILRRRLEVCGPTTATALAHLFGFEESEVETAMLSLESEGILLRGHFEAQLEDRYPKQLQWCDRRLLARIHRLTIARHRARIKPVSPQAYMRFLFHWQHVSQATRILGVDGLMAVIEQLEGYEAGAGSWERELLRVRCKGYLTSWLDQHCLSGQVSWGRVTPPKGKRTGTGSGPLKTTPICFFPRENTDVWCVREEPAPKLAGYASQIFEVLTTKGALFFSQIAEQAGLLPTQVEMGLAELTALGMAQADSFAGLRALLMPSNRKPKLQRRHQRRFGITSDVQAAGRWSSLRVDPPASESYHEWQEEVQAYRARTLLRRYGVVFRKVLEREVGAPRWRDLLDVYRLMEARGELRGGRFVDGFSGEQFALPEAVGMLRKHRDQPEEKDTVVVSAHDPLNLTGIITPGRSISRQGENRVLYRDGLPIASLEASQLVMLTAEQEENSQQAQLEMQLRKNP